MYISSSIRVLGCKPEKLKTENEFIHRIAELPPRAEEARGKNEQGEKREEEKEVQEEKQGQDKGEEGEKEEEEEEKQPESY